MDDLNDKLREILDYCAESYYPLHEYPDQPIYTDQNKVTLDETVAQIHQAYKEAGYENSKLVHYQVRRLNDNNCMTGQAFYDRFEKELQEMAKSGYAFTQHGMLEAAKRASGISERE